MQIFRQTTYKFQNHPYIYSIPNYFSSSEWGVKHAIFMHTLLILHYNFIVKEKYGDHKSNRRRC